MKRIVLTSVLILGLVGCNQNGESASQTAADTLTRRQKDTIVSKFPVPGASGVGRAMDAVDKSNARTQRHDSIR